MRGIEKGEEGVREGREREEVWVVKIVRWGR